MRVPATVVVPSVLRPENTTHSVLYGISGETHNYTVTEMHLSTCAGCGHPTTPIASLRDFALSPTADDVLVQLPHPTVALAYAITEPESTSETDTVQVTTVWSCSLTREIDAVRLTGNGKPATITTQSYDRISTPLSALVLELKKL